MTNINCIYFFTTFILIVALFASQFMQYNLQVIYNYTSFNASALLRKVFGTRHALKVKPGWRNIVDQCSPNFLMPTLINSSSSAVNRIPERRRNNFSVQCFWGKSFVCNAEFNAQVVRLSSFSTVLSSSSGTFPFSAASNLLIHKRPLLATSRDRFFW